MGYLVEVEYKANNKSKFDGVKDTMQFAKNKIDNERIKINKSFIRTIIERKNLENDLYVIKHKISMLELLSEIAVACKWDELAWSILKQVQSLIESEKQINKRIQKIKENARIIRSKR